MDISISLERGLLSISKRHKIRIRIRFLNILPPNMPRISLYPKIIPSRSTFFFSNCLPIEPSASRSHLVVEEFQCFSTALSEISQPKIILEGSIFVLNRQKLSPCPSLL
ncbi:hypothetical protein V6Z12_A11G255700 [Gossypium hirsutum]